MTRGGRVVQISVSLGGVPKRPVETARVTALGVEGDGHRDLRHHGGPERAVCLYALKAIEMLQAEGHPCEPGALGENITVAGVDWEAVEPGRRLGIGAEVLVEITRYTTPCINIRRSFIDGDYSRVSHKRHPGSSRVYARVLREGTVRRGDPVQVLDAADVTGAPVLPFP